MRKNILFNFLAVGILLTGISFLSSCERDKIEPLGDKGHTYIKFVDIGGVGDGFTNSGLAGGTTELPFQLELVTPKVFSSALTVTIAPDESLVAAYNATKTEPSDKYLVLPATAYSLKTTTLTIEPGQTMSADGLIEFVPDQIDGSKNWMIPIKITTISGGNVNASPATSIAYIHFIGNPLAGDYDVEGYFYHPTAPRAFTRTGAEGKLIAVSPTALLTELGDLGAAGYYAVINIPDPNSTDIQKVTITPYPGSITPVYQWDTGLPGGYTAGWAKSDLSNNTYDPATKTFYLRYGYSGANGFRVSEEVIKRK